MKVLVCGPRDWVVQRPIEDVLRRLPAETTIIHGGAPGVDRIAGFVAEEVLNLPTRAYPVDHKLDGPWPGAGPRRNLRMLDAECPGPDGVYVDFGIAFKRQEALTRGTGNMVALMQAGDIPVWEIFWEPSEWGKFLESLSLVESS